MDKDLYLYARMDASAVLYCCNYCGGDGCSECLATNDQDAIDWEADKLNDENY